MNDGNQIEVSVFITVEFFLLLFWCGTHSCTHKKENRHRGMRRVAVLIWYENIAWCHRSSPHYLHCGLLQWVPQDILVSRKGSSWCIWSEWLVTKRDKMSQRNCNSRTFVMTKTVKPSVIVARILNRYNGDYSFLPSSGSGLIPSQCT